MGLSSLAAGRARGAAWGPLGGVEGPLHRPRGARAGEPGSRRPPHFVKRLAPGVTGDRAKRAACGEEAGRVAVLPLHPRRKEETCS